MQPRIEYAKVAPGAMTAMLGLETYVRHCGLEDSLIELVKVTGFADQWMCLLCGHAYEGRSR